MRRARQTISETQSAIGSKNDLNCVGFPSAISTAPLSPPDRCNQAAILWLNSFQPAESTDCVWSIERKRVLCPKHFKSRRIRNDFHGDDWSELICSQEWWKSFSLSCAIVERRDLLIKTFSERISLRWFVEKLFSLAPKLFIVSCNPWNLLWSLKVASTYSKFPIDWFPLQGSALFTFMNVWLARALLKWTPIDSSSRQWLKYEFSFRSKIAFAVQLKRISEIKLKLFTHLFRVLYTLARRRSLSRFSSLLLIIFPQSFGPSQNINRSERRAS